MALIALLDGPEAAAPGERLQGRSGRHRLLRAPNESGFLRLVRERPVSLALVDLRALDGAAGTPSVLDRLQDDFPRLPRVVCIRSHPEPGLLLQLGRHARCTVLTSAELSHRTTFERVIRKALARGPQSIPGRLRGTLPAWCLTILGRAIDAIDQCWSADELAGSVGLRRHELNLRLKAGGLPTAGRLLAWVRVFHAAWWLSDPGRSGVSVARQLEYSSSQALVRVVRNLLGVTPGELASRGGLDWAWLRFLQEHPGVVRGEGAATYASGPARRPAAAGGRSAERGPGVTRISPLSGRPEPLYSDRAGPAPARIA